MTKEQELLDRDLALYGVSLGEHITLHTGETVLIRLSPQYIVRDVKADRWVYMSIDGPVPIVPGPRWELRETTKQEDPTR